MDKSDSSVLRSLAVAFGDGLAFGVGMKLTQKNASAQSGATATAPPEMATRLSRIEQRVDRIERAPAALPGSTSPEPRVLDALTRAVEARIQENTAQMDRRLAEMDVNLSLELKALREQDRALATAAESGLAEVHKRLEEKVQALLRQVNDDRKALQSQVVALHREFAAAVADIVEEQVATQLEDKLSALVDQRLASLVREQMAPLAQELREDMRQAASAQHREIADLRQRLTESDRNVLDVMLTTGEFFRQAATRLGAPALPPGMPATPAPLPEPETPAAAAAAPAETPAGAGAPVEPAPAASPAAPNGTVHYEDAELPSFARARKAAAGAWSIPLVTSFVVMAGCLAWLQYL